MSDPRIARVSEPSSPSGEPWVLTLRGDGQLRVLRVDTEDQAHAMATAWIVDGWDAVLGLGRPAPRVRKGRRPDMR